MDSDYFNEQANKPYKELNELGKKIRASMAESKARNRKPPIERLHEFYKREGSAYLRFKMTQKVAREAVEEDWETVKALREDYRKLPFALTSSGPKSRQEYQELPGALLEDSPYSGLSEYSAKAMHQTALELWLASEMRSPWRRVAHAVSMLLNRFRSS